MGQEKSSKKKKRVLTKAEQERLERFQGIVADMESRGFSRHDLTINIKKANIFAILLLVPLFAIGYGTYYLVNGSFGSGAFGTRPYFLGYFVSYIVLVVIHELIHGFFWSLFTPNHFRDIRFGIMRPSYNPYCTCLVPLEKNQYILGTVMPLVLLGILPMIVGIAVKSTPVLFMGIIMADGAAGDIMIIGKLLGYKSRAKEITYMDHPTEAGGVVFEK